MDTGWDSYDEVTKAFGKPIGEWMKEFEKKVDWKLFIKMQNDIHRLNNEVHELRKYIHTWLTTYEAVDEMIDRKLKGEDEL